MFGVIGRCPANRTFRAFDTETGRELWQAKLPASAMATPVTYRARQGGRQYMWWYLPEATARRIRASWATR